jgi:hypothetical protein
MVEKTICVKRRDEWGNYHDYVKRGNDIVAYIRVSSPGPAPFGSRRTYIITNDKRAIWSTNGDAESYCGEVDVESRESAILDMLKAGAVAYAYKFPRPVNPYVFKIQFVNLEVEIEVEDYEGFKKVMPTLYAEMREYFKRYLNVELP